MKKNICRMIAMTVVLLICAMAAGCDPRAYGEFYTLDEAYELGLLTREELMSIAYYYNFGTRYNEEVMGEDYVPIPKAPEALSKRTADRISSTAAYEYRFDHPAEEAEPEGFPIIEYYGTYGDCVAVMLGFLYGGFFPVAGKVFVADIAFYYLDTNRIKIWKEF